MKRIPDRDWFTANGVCAILEVSIATLSRMIEDRRFPPAEGTAGKRRLWSFASVAEHCTKALLLRQRELFKLMDEIERLEERRYKRSQGLALAEKNEAALERLRRKQIEYDNAEEDHHLRGSVYAPRTLSPLGGAFPFIYPDEPTLSGERKSTLSAERRRWLAVWKDL